MLHRLIVEMKGHQGTTLLRPQSNHNSTRSSASSRSAPTPALVTKPRDELGPDLLLHPADLAFFNLSTFTSHNKAL